MTILIAWVTGRHLSCCRKMSWWKKKEFPSGSPNTNFRAILLTWLRWIEFFFMCNFCVSGQNNEHTKSCMFLYHLPVTFSYSLSYLILTITLSIHTLGTLNSQMTWVEFSSQALEQSTEITPACDFFSCLSQGHRLKYVAKAILEHPGPVAFWRCRCTSSVISGQQMVSLPPEPLLQPH